MGHADALSRCENPHDCECPNEDTMESLKCGPCSKCRKRTQEMVYVPPQSTKNLENQETIKAEGTKGDNSTRSVKTRNQTKLERQSEQNSA